MTISRRLTMRRLFLDATPPRYTHCAHIFDFEHHWDRGASGPWCAIPVQAAGDLCSHHDPEKAARRRATTRLNHSERVRSKRHDVGALVTRDEVLLLHRLGVVDALTDWGA